VLDVQVPSLSLALFPALLLGCRSAEEWSAQADREVYGILAERRAELGARDAFTIEPPADPLRAQLLAGQASGTRATVRLDLVGCLRAAAENSRDWQDQRELLFRSALALTEERWGFTLQERGTLGATFSGTGFQEETEGGFLSNLNLFKLLGFGTVLTADAGLDFLEALGNGDGWDAVSSLSLNITQPILRGFGSDVVKEPLTQAERDVLYQARAYERFRRTFAVDVAQRYFGVLEQLDRLANEEANHRNLVELRQRNEALAEAGRLTDIQVDQARQDELSAEDRLVAARRSLADLLDGLKFQLGLPVETELALEEGGLRSLEAWPALADELPEQQALELGLARRLDLATARDRVEDAERKVRVAADALRMGLDLEARADLASAEDAGDLRLDEVQWSAGLTLDLPIERIPERNAYRASRIDLEARHRALDESSDTVVSELRDALRSLEAARASHRIQSGSVVLAERRVESAALNLDAGRASTRDVLEAQEALLSAQNTLASALTDTILAGLFLYRDMELLEVTADGLDVLRVEVEAPPDSTPPPSGELP
jgi:outer membrane protein TolC